MILNGCDLGGGKQYDPSKYTNVYMPQAQNGPAERSVPIVDTVQTLIYNAAYAGAVTPSEDIPVQFSVRPALVDSFNAANATSHQLLPEESYRLTQKEATIPAGERSTGQLEIELTTEGYLEAQGTKYLLPIRMEVQKEGVRVNTDKQTTYFVIQGSYIDIEKSDWEVVDFDSQEPGRPDLAAPNVIDGNENTIWHTQYSDPRPAPPHFVTIDMGESQKVHGFNIAGRSDSWLIQNPKQITIQFSDDGETWRDGESFTLPFDRESTTTAEIYLSDAVDARYFKFIVEQNVEAGRNPTNLAEISAF